MDMETTAVFLANEVLEKDAGGQNTKINYGLDTMGEKEKRTSKINVDMEGVQAAMTRNSEPDQWRNREEGCLVPRRWRQLLKKPDR